MGCDYCGCDCQDYEPPTDQPRYHEHPIGSGKSRLSVEQAVKLFGLGWRVVTVELDSIDPEDLSGLPLRED